LSKDNQKLQELQGTLISNFLSNDIAANPDFTRARGNKGLVFARQQVLNLMRLTALESPQNGNLLADPNTAGGYQLGECCLVINDHLTSRKQERAISRGSTLKKHKHLALKLAPNFELHTPLRRNSQ